MGMLAVIPGLKRAGKDFFFFSLVFIIFWWFHCFVLTEREFHLLLQRKGPGKFCGEGDEGKKIYGSKTSCCRVCCGFFFTVTCKTPPALCCLQKTWHRHASPLSPPVSPLGWRWEDLRNWGWFGVQKEGSGTAPHLFHKQSHATLSKNRKEKNPALVCWHHSKTGGSKSQVQEGGEKTLFGDFVLIFIAKLSGNAAKYTPFSLLTLFAL